MKTATERVDDPLYGAVQAFWTAYDVYNSTPGEDNEEERAYLDTIRVLDKWDQPAISRAGAVTALRYVVKMSESCYISEDMLSMVVAALAYLEGEAQS